MFSLYFPPQYSGAAKQALSLGRELAARGHHIEFITVRWQGSPSFEQVLGFPVVRLEQGRGKRHRELRLWWNLTRYAWHRRRDFDLIHSHGAYSMNAFVGPLGRCLCWKSVIKASLAQNDLHGVGSNASGRLHQWMLRQVDACIGISQDLRAEFVAAGVQEEQALLIPNGVDTQRFRPPSGLQEKLELRAELDWPKERTVALTVGVFDRRKNIGWLMDQWSRNKGFGTNGLLVAAGPQARVDEDGRFIREIDALATANPHFLRRLDPLEDIERLYRAADLFILPSTNEGLPNVVLEAMASGLPCVASAVSGTREIIVEGVTGCTFNSGSAEGLGNAVRRAVESVGVTFGAAGRGLVERGYSIRVVADRYESVYARLLNGSLLEDQDA